MYSTENKINIITMYYTLKLNNIIGNSRINIISSTFDIHIHTVYNCIAIYVKNNIDILNLIKKLDKNNIHVLRKMLKINIDNYMITHPTYVKYKNKKITNDIETFVVQEITNNCKITVKTIQNKIKTQFLTDISKQTVYAIFHKNNFSNKKLIVKTNPYTIDEQNKQRVDVLNSFNDVLINNIISIDEMSFNLSSEPSKGWSPIGKKCVTQKLRKNVKGIRYSIIMATSNSKIIDYSIIKGSVTSFKFVKFITKITFKYPNHCLFMDNCIIHKSKLMFNTIKNKNLNVVFNAPYHSKFNPIEYIFSMLRKHLNNNVNDTFDDLHNLLKNFKISFNSDILLKIFNNCFNLLKSILT